MTTEPAFDFLGLRGKTFLVMGVANKKSVAYRIATIIEQSGGEVIYSVRSESRRQSLSKLLRDRRVLVCDVEQQEQIEALARQFAPAHPVNVQARARLVELYESWGRPGEADKYR